MAHEKDATGARADESSGTAIVRAVDDRARREDRAQRELARLPAEGGVGASAAARPRALDRARRADEDVPRVANDARTTNGRLPSNDTRTPDGARSLDEPRMPYGSRVANAVRSPNGSRTPDDATASTRTRSRDARIPDERGRRSDIFERSSRGAPRAETVRGTIAAAADEMLIPQRKPDPSHLDPALDLADSSLYINRELSLLEFNLRVLEQAKDSSTPLLERLKFLTICSTNLDEFFEIRVAGLKQQVAYHVSQKGPDGLTPEETLMRISVNAHALVAEQYRVLNEILLPALEVQEIRLVKRADWTPRQQRWIKRYFNDEVLPVLTPIGLDPAHPFPKVLNKSLNFIVSLEGSDAFGRSSGNAVVQVPRSLPRLIALPREISRGPHDFAMLSSIVHAQIDDLFPGMKVQSCHQFRVTRNSDLWVDEEEVDDLLHAIKGELSSRNYGETVRLEVAADCPEEMADVLLENFRLEPHDLYRVNGPVNLHRLIAIHELCQRADLKYPAFIPRLPPRLEMEHDLFDVIRRGDVLLHHPYESFAPVVELVRTAAADPDVLAIKQTLYRTGSESLVVEALVDAARNGKEVTAVIELRARFDEAANIQFATRLQEAGAKVVYGIVGYKAHAKMLLVIRREGRKLRHYVHLGTGNYHMGTARTYTDFGLLTADRSIGEDVHKLFMQLTGLGRVARLEKIRQAPFALQKNLIAMIDKEADAARHKKPARIIAKMNSISEPKVIQALYRASQAGVEIDLIVRGICCLRPGIARVSENIRVRSIIGRFLEHSRVFYFLNGGDELVFCSSADWMQRNFFSRVELCFPIDEPRLKKRVIHEALDVYLADNTQAWTLSSDGKYRRAKPGAQKPRCAQEDLLVRFAS
jgi:polyphosphate kinase